MGYLLIPQIINDGTKGTVIKTIELNWPASQGSARRYAALR